MGYSLLYLPLALILGAMGSWFLAAAIHNRRMNERIAKDAAALGQAEDQVAQILTKLPVGIVVLNAGNREVLFTNPEGKDLLMGRTPTSLPLHDEDGQRLEGANHPFSSGSAGGEARIYSLIDVNQRRRHYDISSMVVSGAASGAVEIVYMIQDETARIETEQALERSHRLEALGSLTSGVAHDFNNMLTPIVGGLDIIRRDPGLSDVTSRAIDRAMQATGRASTLVHRLLAFSRQQELEPHKASLNDLVQGAWDLFGKKLGPNVETYFNARRPVHVEVDSTQLELALLNLMANARDAMPEGGELTITVDEAMIEEGGAGGDLAPGRYGRITVTDTGKGMKDDVLHRAVEPFFTTKEAGQGSGLGLSMVDGFTAQSGGRLDIQSSVGNGTRVDILLPAVEPDARDVESSDDDFVPRRTGTILLVDDEALVRNATAAMLSDIGHRVVEASSGMEAITLLRRGERIDAIVTDHLMPGMTGGAMVHEIWDFMPDMPVLLVSGYSRNDALPRDMTKLAKPFRRIDLARAVDELLPQIEFPKPAAEEDDTVDAKQPAAVTGPVTDPVAEHTDEPAIAEAMVAEPAAGTAEKAPETPAA